MMKQPLSKRHHIQMTEFIRKHITTNRGWVDFPYLHIELGYSIYHLNRIFKTNTGISIKRFAKMYRIGLMRKDLLAGYSVKDAMARNSLFFNASTWRDVKQQLGGNTPTQFLQGQK